MIKNLKGLYKNIGIRGRMIFFFLLLIMIPYIILMAIVMSFFYQHTIRNLGNTTMDTLNVAAQAIHSAMRERENDSMSIYYSECLEYLEEPTKLTREQEREIRSAMDGMTYSNSGIVAAYIIADDRIFHSGGGYLLALDIMSDKREEILNAAGKYVWYSTNQWYCDQGYQDAAPDRNIFVMARSLNSKNKKNVGILCLVLNEQFVYQALGKLSREYSNWYLADRDGLVLYISGNTGQSNKIDVSMLNENVKQEYQTYKTESGQREIIVSYNLMDVGWYCICQIDMTVMKQSIVRLLTPFFLITFIYFCFMIQMLYYMRNGIFRPLDQLKKNLDLYAMDNLDSTQIQINGIDEIESLSRHFNYMTGRIEHLMLEYKKEAEEKTRQELRTLSAQLTPHFIYNALNTIKWIAVLNQQEQIQKLTESLVNIFMNAARIDDGKYALGDELNLIRDYAVIQKARFMNFDLKLEIEEGTETLRVPKLLIQPTVENAIVHGLNRGKIRNGLILIKVFCDDKLHIIVKDNGSGFDVEKWREKPYVEKNHTNIGIHNVEEIILLEYGREYSLGINSKYGEGTTVEYVLPIIKIGENHD